MTCTYCNGHGCEECDNTGHRYHVSWSTGDGLVLSASGSGRAMSDETRAALEEVARRATDRASSSKGVS